MNFKTDLELNKLYKIGIKGGISGIRTQLTPSIFTNGTGSTIDIYVSNSNTQPATLADMYLDADLTAVNGSLEFAVIPTYIAFVQNAGVVSDLVGACISVKDLGAIA